MTEEELMYQAMKDELVLYSLAIQDLFDQTFNQKLRLDMEDKTYFKHLRSEKLFYFLEITFYENGDHKIYLNNLKNGYRDIYYYDHETKKVTHKLYEEQLNKWFEQPESEQLTKEILHLLKLD